jgi:hypothetical protein
MRPERSPSEVSSGVQYVVAAHAIILLALVIYAMVVAMRTARIGREVELLRRLQEREGDTPAQEPASRQEGAGAEAARTLESAEA